MENVFKVIGDEIEFHEQLFKQYDAINDRYGLGYHSGMVAAYRVCLNEIAREQSTPKKISWFKKLFK